jgi:hypothetical protein
MKFHKNPSSGSRVVPCGQTGRHDEADFAKSAKKPKILSALGYEPEVLLTIQSPESTCRCPAESLVTAKS